MKAFKLLVVLVFFTLVAVSCKKMHDDYDKPDGVIESVNDLKVPANFDWKTTQTIDLVVALPESGEIQPLIVTNRDGSVRYFRGFPDDGSRTLRTKITIPSYIKDLRFIYNGSSGPNIAYIGESAVTYNFNSAFKSTSVVTCDLDGYKTYSRGGWGQIPRPPRYNNVIPIGWFRDNNFSTVYPNGNFVVGIGNSVTFNSGNAIGVCLSAVGGGTPRVLDNGNVLNPAGPLGNMANQIIAARLNRDYSAAGVLGTNSAGYTLGELVFISGPFANTTVNDFLIMAETALGGGDMRGLTASEWSSAAESIVNSFIDGVNGNVLTCPTDPELDDPYIEVSSKCLSSDVIFTISNTGDGNMTSAFDYSVTKNGVEAGNGTYQLDVNENLELTYSGLNTDEFSIVVKTPGNEDIQVTISGCGSQEPQTEQYAGTLAYEDLWPGKGDYDFNDLIIDYDFAINKDNQEKVQSIIATFVVKAFGASYHNGFGFTLPAVSPEDIVSVSGYDVINNTVFNIAGNGLENNQSKATIIVFDDVRRVMPQTTGGIGVNTQLEHNYTEPVTIVVNIVFANNAITYSELNIGSFNPFLVVNTEINGAPGKRGWEIHLPNYEPSDLMDTSLLGQWEDNSSAAVGRYFVTSDNLPWAINIAEGFDWVIEFQDITGAYNHFAEWAQSGGTNYQDWYKNLSGYRNDDKIYPTQIGN